MCKRFFFPEFDSGTLYRVVFTLSTFCIIWKDTIFSVISILNFFKSIGSQTFMKTKIILKSNTIVFDPFNLFVFVNICLLVLFKKFNMDITEKMVSFQIIQNVLILKRTLVDTVKDKNLCTIACFWSKTTLIASSVCEIGVNPPLRKINTFCLRSLALSVPIYRHFQSNGAYWRSIQRWTKKFI